MIYRCGSSVLTKRGSADGSWWAIFCRRPITVFYAALLLPFFAGRKLYLGFRERDRTRAERAAAAEAIRAAEEWRSARRW
ncbi:hypothetical protein ACFYPX_23355 [Micromonospora zamorensis]|uniref:hypothetical protein n=1 Tax=Micromonospora zamorensis TaxID=709883 RepID=UPI0036ABC722